MTYDIKQMSNPNDDEEMHDFKEIGNATDLPAVIIDIITSFQSRCLDFFYCQQHLSENAIVNGLEYCEKCTKECIMPNCRKTFTPDNEGTYYTEGMCGDCSVCKYCGGIQEGPGCYCDDACGDSGLAEEPPNTRGWHTRKI